MYFDVPDFSNPLMGFHELFEVGGGLFFAKHEGTIPALVNWLHNYNNNDSVYYETGMPNIAPQLLSKIVEDLPYYSGDVTDPVHANASNAAKILFVQAFAERVHEILHSHYHDN